MMRQPNNELNIDKWLEKANEDEINSRSILKHRDGTPSLVCFLSQQVAEKYLKALLIFHSQTFLRIHDLKRLATLLEPSVSDIFNREEEFNILNKYYPATRYPGDLPEGFTWQDAEEAFAAALRIKKFIVSKIRPK